MQHKGLLVLQRVERADGQDGQQQRRRRLGRPKRCLMQEGEMVMEAVEVGREVSVQTRSTRQAEGVGQRVLGVFRSDAVAHLMPLLVAGELRRPR